MDIISNSRDTTSTKGDSMIRPGSTRRKCVMLISKVRSGVVATFAAVGMMVSAAPVTAQALPDKSFFEDWNQIDLKRWYVSNGWVNGAYQSCAWSKYNVRAVNGRLQLLLTKAPNALRTYRCAEIRTHVGLGYGLYEARIRTAAGSGLNTAMFTYSGPPMTKVHDELDFEFLG